MDAIYRASAEVLLAATRLGSDPNLPPPDRLRQEILGMLQRMVSRCREGGIADPEIAEARYAIVAFIDERILKSNWNGRAEWMSNPLQLQLYREYAAGENFFARMRALQKREAAAALEVYFLCLALGFTGALPGVSAEQSSKAYVEAIRARLFRAPWGPVLSPHAVPGDHPTATAPRRPVVLGLALCCAVIVAAGLSVLGWSLGDNLHRIEHRLREPVLAGAVDAPGK